MTERSCAAEADRAFISAHAGERIQLIADSHLRLAGRPLLDGVLPDTAELWHAPFVLIAHGIESDPLFFYGNRKALDLFAIDTASLTCMPSRLSAEPVDREERARLFDRVRRSGHIDDYAGERIAANGRRFRIAQATVWNLEDGNGHVHGQAARFDDWVWID